MKRIFSLVLILGCGFADAWAQDLPLDKLKVLFPAASSFKASKKTVTDAKRADVESLLGQKLTGTDLQPQFYIAMKAEGGPVGVAYFGTVGDGAAGVEFGVAVTTAGGDVGAVKIFAPPNSPLAAETFLKQFEGRTVSTVKPPSLDQQALVDFLRAQDDNMLTMDEPQKTIVRKLNSASAPLADEPAVFEKGMSEYERLLAATNPATMDPGELPKLQALTKDAVAAAQTFSAEVKSAGGDLAKISKPYNALDAACEKCHADYESAFKKKRKDFVSPRGASEFRIGKDLTAPADQDAAAQALATEVKKAVALIKVLYSLK